jgi:hypothetical protein
VDALANALAAVIEYDRPIGTSRRRRAAVVLRRYAETGPAESRLVYCARHYLKDEGFDGS